MWHLQQAPKGAPPALPRRSCILARASERARGSTGRLRAGRPRAGVCVFQTEKLDSRGRRESRDVGRRHSQRVSERPGHGGQDAGFVGATAQAELLCGGGGEIGFVRGHEWTVCLDDQLAALQRLDADAGAAQRRDRRRIALGDADVAREAQARPKALNGLQLGCVTRKAVDQDVARRQAHGGQDRDGVGVRPERLALIALADMRKHRQPQFLRQSRLRLEREELRLPRREHAVVIQPALTHGHT
mmetsp:Transcript_3936/g.13776  ORF Transcript_3936/g.13776 Transcript_3936/m.13776 type:complete len:245 (+) Transcript_3936:108-842(+)